MAYDYPFKGGLRVTSSYGVTRPDIGQADKSHNGLDMVGLSSKEIYPISSGTVSRVSYDKTGYGNYVIINHSDGSGSSLYAHMAGTPNVSVGQTVGPNTLLGIMGNTGNSFGAHLHLEIQTTAWDWSRKSQINPANALGISNTPGTIVQDTGALAPSNNVNNGNTVDYSADSPLVNNNTGPRVILDGYEILPNLDSQPYYAFVDLTFGSYKFPNVPPEYIRSVTIQDISGKGASITMSLLDEFGDDIEELLFRTVSTENYIRFGHRTGRQSTTFKFNLLKYTVEFESQGTVVNVAGISDSTAINLKNDVVKDAGSNPSEAVKILCDELGVSYDDESIQPSESIMLSDGTYKQFKLVKDRIIDYIHHEISPYAISSDGRSGYQFYIDEFQNPPKAYFHPIEVSGKFVKTYIYQRGVNSNVISFNISSEFILSGEGSHKITSILEASVLDPVTKNETSTDSDINVVNKNVSDEYSHINSSQSKKVANITGNNYIEAYNKLTYRMTTSQVTFNADLTIVGDPTVKIGDEIRIIVLTKRNTLHHTSGRFLVNGVSHIISSGIMVTTLSVVKEGDIDGIELKAYKSRYK